MKELFYIGSYSKYITVAEFKNEKLKIVNKSENITNPSYLHMNKDVLYAVSETNIGEIDAFYIKKENLELFSSRIINQKLPCHITTDSNRKKLLISNYGSGSLIHYNLNEDASIGDKIKEINYKNSHMHYSEVVDDKIFAVDLGNDIIYIYDEKLTLLSQIRVKKGSGPRHLVINSDNILIVTELSNELLVYKKEKNKIELIQQLNTFDNKQNIESYAGAIKISNDGKNIYITNRGHNSISVFRKYKDKLIQNISCFGEFPRDIVLNETEEYLFVANQKSNNIKIFKRNKKNGILKEIKDAELIIESPSCIVRRNYEI